MPNRVCELFGVRYPVVMGAISQSPELAAAVSNAGGLGCMAGAAAPPDSCASASASFANSPTSPSASTSRSSSRRRRTCRRRWQLMVEERVPVVITSAGNPKLWTKFLKDGGCRVAHVLPTLYHARKAVEAGVDAIIAEPAESGGYRGEQEVSMMVLIPAIRRAFPEIPLLAAGAVADGPASPP